MIGSSAHRDGMAHRKGRLHRMRSRPFRATATCLFLMNMGGLPQSGYGAHDVNHGRMAERTERTETRFIQQFSDAEIFECRNGKSSLTLGVSAALSSAIQLPEMPHEQRARVLGIEISPAPHSGGKGIARFWALVSFEAQDQRLLGQLNNGATLHWNVLAPHPIGHSNLKQTASVFSPCVWTTAPSTNAKRSISLIADGIRCRAHHA